MKKSLKYFFILAIVAIITFGYFFITSKTFRDDRLILERFIRQLSYSTEDMLASVIYSNEKIKIPIDFKKQEHAVTCEIASLRMVLNYFGSTVTEEELIIRMPFDTKEPKINDIWGDPNKGFVGNVDGSIFLGTGYGVYETPIRDLALSYRDSFIIDKAKLSRVLSEVDQGRPVIVWGLLSNPEQVQWKTKNGKKIVGYVGEHARVVIGYAGKISDPSHIVLMDPIYGKIRMNKEKFLADWKIMENKAVVVY